MHNGSIVLMIKSLWYREPQVGDQEVYKIKIRERKQGGKDGGRTLNDYLEGSMTIVHSFHGLAQIIAGVIKISIMLCNTGSLTSISDTTEKLQESRNFQNMPRIHTGM